MTSDEWFNVRPKDSFVEGNYKFKEEPIDFNIIIEYPKRVVSKDELKDFLKRRLFWNTITTQG